MAKILSECPSCGAAIEMHVGQYIVHYELVWSQGYRCGSCGNAVEADGQGLPPPAIVDAILADEGEWELWIRSADGNEVLTLRALRAVLGFELAEVSTWKSKLPGPMASGTKTQIEWLVKMLQREGVAAEIQRKSASPS